MQCTDKGCNLGSNYDPLVFEDLSWGILSCEVRTKKELGARYTHMDCMNVLNGEVQTACDRGGSG